MARLILLPAGAAAWLALTGCAGFGEPTSVELAVEACDATQQDSELDDDATLHAMTRELADFYGEAADLAARAAALDDSYAQLVEALTRAESRWSDLAAITADTGTVPPERQAEADEAVARLDEDDDRITALCRIARAR